MTVKLVKRKLSEGDERQHPFLNFTITTHTHSIVQDVPLLSKPLVPTELREVIASGLGKGLLGQGMVSE